MVSNDEVSAIIHKQFQRFKKEAVKDYGMPDMSNDIIPKEMWEQILDIVLLQVFLLKVALEAKEN